GLNGVKPRAPGTGRQAARGTTQAGASSVRPGHPGPDEQGAPIRDPEPRVAARHPADYSKPHALWQSRIGAGVEPGCRRRGTPAGRRRPARQKCLAYGVANSVRGEAMHRSFWNAVGVAILGLWSFLAAAETKPKSPPGAAPVGPLSPREERVTFRVADGFRVE